jgi:hypothetical protein
MPASPPARSYGATAGAINDDTLSVVSMPGIDDVGPTAAILVVSAVVAKDSPDRASSSSVHDISPSQATDRSTSDIEEPYATPLLYSPKSETRRLRYAFFTMFPMFMGYAAMVTMQDNIKNRLHIGDNGSSSSYEFSFATSLLYLGNLIFRLMHNVILAPARPRHRVGIAYLCMTLATGMLGVIYYLLDSKNIAYVYVAYLLGGVAIGTFESNLISVITPLGHQTKVWAQFGIPLGFNGVSVGAFLLFALYPGDLHLQCGVYLFISLANLLGLIFFYIFIPDITFESSHKTLAVFVEDVKQFRSWAPKITCHAIALCVDMFAVSFASAIQLYIYNVAHIPLYLHATATIPKNAFRAWFNCCSLLGDATGRKLAYSTHRHYHPFYFLIATVAGVGMVLSKTALLAPFGMMAIMFANGSIYAHTTKYVDDVVQHQYNLISLSAWLFVGDIGSFSGSNVVNAVRVALGSV